MRREVRVTPRPCGRRVSPTEAAKILPCCSLPSPARREGGAGSPRALQGTGKAACPEAFFILKRSGAPNPQFYPPLLAPTSPLMEYLGGL